MLAGVAEDGGLVIAGGQSLVPMLALRVADPGALVDINGVAGLDHCAVRDGTLAVGATVRHARFHKPVVEGPLGRLLTTVARHIAHYPIRQRGTMCGSLAHADPASEWCLVAATLGAEITLASARGTRTVGADGFLDGVMTTTREADEILTEVRLPLLGDATRFGFYEFSRRPGDFALGMALVAYELRDGRMANVRIGVGGIEDRARRVTAAERRLEGQAPDPALVAEVALDAAAAMEAMEDPMSSADYRRDIAAVAIRRAFAASLDATA